MQTTQPANSEPLPQLPKPRWQIDLIWAAGGVAFGLCLLPALVYFAGQFLLGAYGGGSIADFYARYFQSLAQGAASAWSLVLGPGLMIVVIRYFFRLFPKPVSAYAHLEAQPAVAQSPVSGASSHQRREPFVGT
jgi:hypothetical protein